MPNAYSIMDYKSTHFEYKDLDKVHGQPDICQYPQYHNPQGLTMLTSHVRRVITQPPRAHNADVTCETGFNIGTAHTYRAQVHQ